jgi:FixJ family two-component response regulator
MIARSYSIAILSPVVTIVDDDLSLCRSTRRLIQSFGFRATTFASAWKFLCSDRIDDTECLILDVRMPGLDGLALQRWLAAAGHVIPIVFVSAVATNDEQRQAIDGGAIAFLRKPVATDALMHAIHGALQQRSTRDGGNACFERPGQSRVFGRSNPRDQDNA